MEVSIPVAGTLTFMFTDIEGSTRLWEQYPSEMALDLARHLEIVLERVAAHGGQNVRERGEGDSTFNVFPTAPAALFAACEIQKAVCAEAWRNPEGLSLRIAMHTGHAKPLGNDFNSSAVNRCARLRSLAHGGQVLATRACAELCWDVLPPTLELRDLGVHRLKDLSRPEQVYQAIGPGMTTDFPPLESGWSPPDNLPEPTTSFVGREIELAEVRQALVDSRIVTLAGIGGVGKTRLAIQVAFEKKESFPDGVWLVEWASCTQGEHLVGALADALKLTRHGGLDIEAQVCRHLSDHTALLVLDNCEQAVEAAARVAERLLHECPRVHLLATSREPLGLPGELVYRVPMLAGPRIESLSSQDDLSRHEATRLFLERAARIAPDAVYTDQACRAIGAICQRLDGIPLAIELAAARTRNMSPQEIESRLADRFALLTSGPRTATDRQKTLQGLFDWSYDLLTEAERSALGRLSLFPGGWTLEAAASLVGCSDWEAMDLMDRLAEKSLVLADPSRATTRYRMLETVRAYFRGRLDASLDRKAAVAGQLAYLADLAARADRQIKGGDQTEWLDRLALEHENFREALSLAEDDPNATAQALEIGCCLWHLWILRCQFSEGRARLEAFLGREDNTLEPDLMAKALTSAGVLASREGDFEGALLLHVRSLEVAERAGSARQTGVALNNIGLTHFLWHQYDKAEDAYVKSLSCAKESGFRHSEATVLSNLGSCAIARGEPERSLIHFEESLAIRREIGDRYGYSIALAHRGNARRALGDFDGAEKDFAEALAIKEAIGDREGQASVMSSRGALEHLRGNLGDARRQILQCLEMLKDLPSTRVAPEALERLAEVLVDEGSPERAARLVGCARSLRSAGFPRPPELARLEERLKASLGDWSYGVATEQGKSLTLAQVLEEFVELE